MARLPDAWKNTFTYEGWILDVSEPEDRDGLLGYHVRVGFSEDEQIRVMAFRRKPTQSLVKGAAVRVTGNFRFIPDASGLVRLKLDASRIEVIEPPA